MELKDRVRLQQLKKLYPTCHFSLRRGTGQQASDYCQKEDTRAPDGVVYKEGTMRVGHQGARNDITDACAILKERGLVAVAEDAPEVFVKFHNGFKALAQLIAAKREPGKRTVYVLYGPPGTGKSYYARELAKSVGNSNFYLPAANNQGRISFESYQNESTIILDDFDPSQISPGQLKMMLDRYQGPLPGRGVSPENNADQIIITSNSDPKTWWDKDPTFWPALSRRASHIIFCGKNDWSSVVIDGAEVIPDSYSVGIPFPKPSIPCESAAHSPPTS